jgi:hypothetical protein
LPERVELSRPIPGELFAILYSITEEEWDRTAAQRFDPDAQPIFERFYGDVQLYAGGQLLLGTGYHMSVADLARGLAVILSRDLPELGDRDSAVFEQSDDALRINFERRGDRLTIASNHGAAQGETSMPAFLVGTKAFLRRFAKEASIKIPGALDWKDLQVLRPYV